jgi:hypothetical protein
MFSALGRRAAWAGIVVVVAVALDGIAAAAGISRGSYTGVAGRGDRHMDVALQLLPGAHSTKWRVDVYAPCSEPNIDLGVSVGTGTSPGVRPLRVRAGRFAISRHYTVATHPDTYRYTLSGHAANGGFSGTFHLTEVSNYTIPATVCDSKLLHWHAHPTSAQAFP